MRAVRCSLTACVIVYAITPALSPAAATPALAQPAPTEPATEQPDAEYTQLVLDAVTEFDAGRWAEARALFERAHARMPSARTLRGLGITAFELRRYAQAIHELNAALADERYPLSEAQRVEARDVIARAERYVAVVSVDLAPAQAQLWVDGQRVHERELVLEPGAHRLLARARGYRDGELQLGVVGGQKRLVQLELARAELPQRPAPPYVGTATPAPAERDGGVLQSFWFWTAVGVVVTGGVVAAVIALEHDASDEPNVDATAEALTVGRW